MTQADRCVIIRRSCASRNSVMTYHLNVAPNGRVVLPADVRKRLGLAEGGELADGGDTLTALCSEPSRRRSPTRRRSRVDILANSPEYRWTPFSHNAAPIAANDGDRPRRVRLVACCARSPGERQWRTRWAGARMSMVNFAEVVCHFTYAGLPAGRARRDVIKLTIEALARRRRRRTRLERWPSAQDHRRGRPLAW